MLSFAHVSSRAKKQIARYYFVQGLTQTKQQKYIENRGTRRSDLDFALYLATRWENRHVRLDDVEERSQRNVTSKKHVPRQIGVKQVDKITVADAVLLIDDRLKQQKLKARFYV